jgi:hypothetical protein
VVGTGLDSDIVKRFLIHVIAASRGWLNS